MEDLCQLLDRTKQYGLEVLNLEFGISNVTLPLGVQSLMKLDLIPSVPLFFVAGFGCRQ